VGRTAGHASGESVKRRYPERILAEIRSEIVTIVSQYVSLKPAGAGGHKGLCPFHSETNPSFFVNTPKQFAHCFGCSFTGDVFGFLQRIECISFLQAIHRAAEISGIGLKYEAIDLLEARRRQLIRNGANIWREEQTLKHGEELRRRDGLVLLARQIAEYCETESIAENLRDEAVSEFLAEAYNGYSRLEYQFEQLLRADLATAELHRELISL
jgi:DNA primase